MNAPLRKAGVVAMVLFGLLFANLNWVQAYRADDYRNDEHNGRVQVDEYKRPRGVIEAEGEALAQSQVTVGRLKYQRVYPRAEQYAHVLGYKPVNGAATGIEAAENDFLAGTSDNLFADRISDLFTGAKTSGGNVQLTLKLRAQEAAYKNLTENEIGVKKGAAIAIDPRTGAVQAMVSVPSFDPNQLVSHDTAAVTKAYKQLTPAKGDDGPLLNRAVARRLPPGSTFKIVVAAAALENGVTQQTKIPAGSTYTAPTSGSPIKNAAPSICPESEVTLLEAVTESCNTGFAQLGVSLGAEKVKAKARAFGFETKGLTVGGLADEKAGLPVTPSITGEIKNPAGGDDPAALAQSSIGQNNVAMTPLQGAMIASAVANGGVEKRPYLVAKLLGADRRPIYNATPKDFATPVTGQVATDLQDMMVSVVQNGTGKKAKIGGFKVGGKTGTAQTDGTTKNIGWFIGFAINDKGEPVSAVCVLLEDAGDGGSSEAARIGGQIMRAAAGVGSN